MSQKLSPPFDAFHKWLGIPPEEEPPNHYRLLGIKPFESDVDVIENAADKAMSHLRNLQTGSNAQLANQLLNKVSAARVALLNADYKTSYDEELSAKLRAASPITSAPISQLSPPIARHPVQTRQAKTPSVPVLQVVITASLIIGIAATLYFVFGSARSSAPLPTTHEKETGEDHSTNVVQNATSTTVSPVGQTDAGKDHSIREAATSPAVTRASPLEGNPAENLENVVNANAAPNSTVEVAAADGPAEEETPASPKVAADVDAQAEPLAIPKAVKPALPDNLPFSEKPKASGSEKAAVPPEASRREALKAIRGLFNKEYVDAKSPEQKSTFAKELIRHASSSKDDQPSQYVLLDESRRLAAEASDPDTVIASIAALAATYQVDDLALTTESFENGFKGPIPPAARAKFIDTLLTIEENAIRRERFDLAMRLLAIAKAAATKANNRELAAVIGLKLKEARDEQKSMEAAVTAKAVLAKDPEDPAANLAVGKYYALLRRDWKQGLPFLVRGSDEGLQAAAKLDLSDPKVATEQLALADTWMELAKKQSAYKRAFIVRAFDWCEKASRTATGLPKARAEKLREELRSKAIPVVTRLVIHNQHGGTYNDRGTKRCNFALYQGKKEVWSAKGVEIPWEPNVNRQLAVDVPGIAADKLRIEITEWHGYSGGLSEAEVFSGSYNVAGVVRRSQRAAMNTTTGVATTWWTESLTTPEECGYPMNTLLVGLKSF